jgi:hypothetical protein
MFTTCRIYTGAKDLADLIIANRGEVEAIVKAVPGFQAYYLVRTEDGFVSVTVCDNQAGAEDSNQRAAEYVRSHAGGMSGGKPQVMAGDTPFSFTATKAAVSA